MTGNYRPNYPELAETTFQKLCDQQNVSRNKATQDRTGWDFLVEFDQPKIAGIAHDQQKGSSTARVQVKSKIGGRPSASLKLTNALRFTRESDVCFVVLFWFSKDGKAEKIYACHFHSELMAAALRRAREAERDGDDALNRIQIPIKFSDEDDHSSDLIDWMKRICDQQPETYALDKRALAETLGFDATRAAGSFTVKLDNLQALIDHSVGLVPAAPIENFTIHNRRFDIPARSPLFSGKPDFARIEVNPLPATLTVVGANGQLAVIEGESRSFAWPGLPTEMARVAFSSPCITAVLSGDGQFEINYVLEFETRYALNVLIPLCKFYLASQSSLTVELTIGSNLPIFADTAAEPPADSQWFEWFFVILESLQQCCSTMDFPTLSPKEVDDAHPAITDFSNSVVQGEATLRFGLDRDLQKLPFAKNLAGYALVAIGEHVFWVVVRRPCLRQDYENGRWTIVFGDPIVLASGVGDGSLDGHLAELRRQFVTLSKKLGDGVVTINEGDLMSLNDRPMDIGFA